jgi:hypothetical protein
MKVIEQNHDELKIAFLTPDLSTGKAERGIIDWACYTNVIYRIYQYFINLICRWYQTNSTMRR